MTDAELVAELRNTNAERQYVREAKLVLQGERDLAADRIEALTAERDRLREALRDGRRLLAIAQDDRVRLLIQLEQCDGTAE